MTTNFLRVIQYGIDSRDALDALGSDVGKRRAMACREFFFDEEDPAAVAQAVASARAYRDALPIVAWRGRARVVTYRRLPAYPEIAVIGPPAEVGEDRAA